MEQQQPAPTTDQIPPEEHAGLTFGDGFQFGCGFAAAVTLASILLILGLLLLLLILSLSGINLLHNLIGFAPLV
jgi:hypothetical protein